MAGMKFIKMHGLGNDYIYVDCRRESLDNPAALAVELSDRHTGIGGDGLILIHPSNTADARMEMYNADGSRAEMCGNGLRCVAKYVCERSGANSPLLRIETDAGTRHVECEVVGGVVQSVSVDMGVPILEPTRIPVLLDGNRVVDRPINVEGQRFAITCVSLGNPHAVVFVEDPQAIDLKRIGPAFEHYALFPQRVNAHFVRVDGPHHLTMRTWERGAGATRACGSGACAAGVAGALSGRTEREVTVTLPGGDLRIAWAANEHVWMTGPAVEVFRGEWRTGEPGAAINPRACTAGIPA